MLQPAFSIIVPVYNAEKYLKSCLDSITNQTYSNLEVLLIDDGSKDNSGNICDTYSASDSRFKTFHLNNGGVSRARNYGLAHASGRYVTFIDSDDTIEPDALETYLSAFQDDNQIDAIKAGYYDTIPDLKTEIISTDRDYLFADKSDLFRQLEHSRYYSFVWNLCIRREAIKNIRFNEAINWLEDHIFSYECYLNCRKIKVISKPLYHYFTRENEAKSLSYVKDPWVIKTSMDLEYDWKTKLNNGKHEDIYNQTQKNYYYNIHRLVDLLYTLDFTSTERKFFMKNTVKEREFLFKEEKIFYNPFIPPFIKNLILNTLYRYKK